MSGTRRERVLREAAISRAAVRYQVLAAAGALAATVLGIPLIPIVLPAVYLYYKRYYARLRVVLTSRELKVQRGILVVEEKSIPLEKITDLAVFQGPIMRSMNLKGIRVETAGQTGSGSALVRIIGLEDTDGFRDLVLEQRDRIADREDLPAVPAAVGASPGAPGPGSPELLAAVMEIRDVLRRIEAGLDRPRDGVAP